MVFGDPWRPWVRVSAWVAKIPMVAEIFATFSATEFFFLFFLLTKRYIYQPLTYGRGAMSVHTHVVRRYP